MTEIVCINGKFPIDYVEYYNKFGVQTPKENSIYNIRDVINYTNGSIGILLEEIVNPKIPIFGHPVLGSVNMEPSWAISRFTKLDGSVLSKREIEKELKNNKIKV